MYTTGATPNPSAQGSTSASWAVEGDAYSLPDESSFIDSDSLSNVEEGIIEGVAELLSVPGTNLHIPSFDGNASPTPVNPYAQYNVDPFQLCFPDYATERTQRHYHTRLAALRAIHKAISKSSTSPSVPIQKLDRVLEILSETAPAMMLGLVFGLIKPTPFLPKVNADLDCAITELLLSAIGTEKGGDGVYVLRPDAEQLVKILGGKPLESSLLVFRLPQRSEAIMLVFMDFIIVVIDSFPPGEPVARFPRNVPHYEPLATAVGNRIEVRHLRKSIPFTYTNI